MTQALRQYAIITGNYWVFTLTDGALRMLVVLHFNALGYSPLEIAMLFLFYEFFGVVTNLIGGWLGARIGLNRTMHMGLFLQVGALLMLTVPAAWLTVPWVMAAQALSGIAKDLNKMSAKSSIKLLIPEDAQGRLYHWIAVLTGSKNTLKGVGFFMGAALLALFGFSGAVWTMVIMLLVVAVASLFMLSSDLGKARDKPKFRAILSRDSRVNRLSAARVFLFGARDVWFVVALPVFMASQLGWESWWVGAFMAAWVIGYGGVQTQGPRFTRSADGDLPDGRTAAIWAFALAGVTMLIAIGLDGRVPDAPLLVVGLLVFGALFAINSALHSYLIVSYARADGVSMDVGFYYMSNALGRLTGTVLSGWVYQVWGLQACLLVSAAFILMAAVLARPLPRPGPSAA
ncbi:organoarsenical effux MFS transporter ArsJ [Natronospirillum operosum]|uniref:Organoarsenical effux MFS transporter ArsJ n=1 Tax=Natronospirillum operosum TaxID=2759953 RepID=A0A4Z0WCZ4_9GAMM|nr:organoarsenical effux MFS transporter ArsJ [Natronospirillum operosum]TGG93973.1 organoarsenical effux MFS transporter ArsJ [Natronospirillum operosum]